MNQEQLGTEDQLMMASNIFLLSPVIIAGALGEWLYLGLASGIMICSPLFHWYRIVGQYSRPYWVFRILDWTFALAAFAYMYWYVYHHHSSHQVTLFTLLSVSIIFFWYGWRYGYRAFHPWFHFVAAGVSSIVLLL